MRKFILALLAMPLVACTEAQKDDAFFVACASVPTADALFQTYVATGRVKQNVIDAEHAAIAAAQVACAGPRPSDSRTTAAYVQRVMATVLVQIAIAKKQSAT